MDFVSRKHLTKDVNLNAIIIILMIATRVHVVIQEER